MVVWIVTYMGASFPFFSDHNPQYIKSLHEQESKSSQDLDEEGGLLIISS